jgi:hypothetical protein
VPLDLVAVERVDPCMTANPQVTSFTVTGLTVEDQPRTVQFHTICQRRAALCERSTKIGQHVWIYSKQSRYGWDIVKVEPDASKFQHESEAS